MCLIDRLIRTAFILAACTWLMLYPLCADGTSVTDVETETVEEIGNKPSPLSKRMATYEKFAQEVRELKFKQKVKYRDVRKEEVKEILSRKLEKDIPEKEFNEMAEAYVKIGLLEKSEGLREVLLDMFSEQVAGFYDPDNHILFAIKDLDLGPQFDSIIYVHELTHALQDQHFDLNSLGLDDKTNDDKVLAMMSLIEGDATLTMVLYFVEYGKFSLDMLGKVMTMDNRKLQAAPYVLRRNILFPYKEGFALVSRIQSEKGWEGVNKAFRKPPQSSEQILHPEKYIDNPDPPTDIELPDLDKALGKDWELIENNVMGELNTQILFRTFLGRWRYKKPSRGWDGDRFNVLKHTGDGSMLLAWESVWDSAKDVDEFFAAYEKLLDKKYPKVQFKKTAGMDAIHLESEKLWIFIGKTGTKALTVEAPGEDLMKRTVLQFSDFKKYMATTDKEHE